MPALSQKSPIQKITVSDTQVHNCVPNKRGGNVMEHLHQENLHTPWNKGKLVGQKLPLKLQEIWAIRVRLQLAG